MMMSDELIRVAILWHEQWHEALEEASRLYFGERNIQGMLAKVRSGFAAACDSSIYISTNLVDVNFIFHF